MRAYCDAEVLRWQPDAANEKLTLSNTRVTLNCCGEHSIDLTAGQGEVVIDASESTWCQANAS